MMILANHSIFDSVYKVDQVARIFKLTPRQVMALIRDGNLPAIRLGKHYRISKTTITDILNKPPKATLTLEDIGAYCANM